MYLEHFGLKEWPFSLTPDTQFAFSHDDHQAALNTVLLALGNGEGFIKITGEVGAGKTLLCRRLLRSLDSEKTAAAYLPNPNLDTRTLYLAVADELGLTLDGSVDDHHLIKSIQLQLLHIAEAGRNVVLCVDEAQAMPMQTLEALRLLSNLETEKSKLMQIVLFGQPELDEKLRREEIRQLLQRITFHYRLSGLNRDDVGRYLAHRLRVAGHRADPIFRGRTVAAMFRASGGTPRLINVLAHKAMIAAFGEGVQTIEVKHVRAACNDTEGALRLPWWMR